MLAEYLQRKSGAVWNNPVPGVRVCRFAGATATTTAITPTLAPLHFEAFFCRCGRLQIQRHQERLSVTEREVFLLSDVGAISAASLSGDLGGVLVAVDARHAQESLQALCTLTGGKPLNTAAVGRRMQECAGSAVIGASPWSGSVFDNLARLDEEEHGRYCLLKALELLYLLSCRDLFQTAAPTRSPADNPLAPLMTEMAAYMRQHLGDKLTIDVLSAHFGVSQTVLKKEFRRLFGQPIHAWLQEQRLTHAACLLRESPMTVLEIAHEVGYSSTSQFSSAFNKRYGATPGQYRRQFV